MEFNISKAAGILINKLESWLESFIALLPNLIVAILVLILFSLAARVLRNISRRILSSFSDRAAINNLFSTLLYLCIMGVGVIISLNILQLDQAVTSILAGAGIIGLALGFAFQDISANFIAGIIMAIRRPIVIGDIIETKDYLGKVEEIDLRATVIRTFQGLHVIIPNKDVFQSPLVNYTKTNDRRIDLEVGVSYGDDLEKVKRVTLETIENLPHLLHGKEVRVFFNGFGNSSIDLTIMFWIQYDDEPGFWEARSEAVMKIKKAYDQNNITIPFPIRTLDFGIKGGKTLSEMQLNSKGNE